MSQNTINCPNCGTNIDVNNLVFHQLQEKANQDAENKYQNKLKEIENKKYEFEEIKKNYDKERELIQSEKEKLQKEKADSQSKIDEAVKNQVKIRESQLEKEVIDKVKTEFSEQLKSQQEELDKKSAELKEFHKLQADIARLEREKNEMKEKLDAENQIQLNQKLSENAERIRKEEQIKNEMINLDKDKQIADLKKSIEESSKKANQGSMQAQGEVQELAIENYLKNQYPFDQINEVKKGASGADCVQIVRNERGIECGAIYYESKRTKAFAGDWIEKFKNDMRNANIRLGVLVTEVMPKEMERMGLKDGVWICNFEEFKGLSAVLRQYLIDLNYATAAQENKGDKMNMLYDFLTGNEFRSQIEAIVEGFSQMKTDLDKEKNAMNNIWKKREKQIEKVLENTTSMYGSIKGIAGNAIQPIKTLELGDGIDEELMN